MAESLKEKTAKGLLWGGLGNGMMQVLGALFGIVLLRILSPSDYGKIAQLLVFSNIANSLQESGFIAALINKKDATHRDYNAVFWFNLIVSFSVYGILWLASPLIADFYREPVLTPLARYLFLGFVITAFGTVQRAYTYGHLMVKQSSIITISALVISNVVGIVMALNDFAFWGLATQTILYTLICQMGYWHISPFRPTFKIDLQPAFNMFGFSSKLLATNLFTQLNSQVFSILFGRFYSDQVTGYYSNARKWNDMASNTINGMMSGVSQPVLAGVVDEDARYRQVFRKMLRFVSFVSFPCMFGLALISKDFILITVGEKWADSASMLSMLCIYGAIYPITILYSNMTTSRGKSGINLFCTITLCVIVWMGLIGIHGYGVHYMIVFFVTINILWLFVWQWFAWKLFKLSFIDAFRDVLPFALVSLFVMAATHFATITISNIYIAIVAKIILAIMLYVGIMYLSKAVILREAIEYFRNRKK